MSVRFEMFALHSNIACSDIETHEKLAYWKMNMLFELFEIPVSRKYELIEYLTDKYTSAKEVSDVIDRMGFRFYYDHDEEQRDSVYNSRFFEKEVKELFNKILKTEATANYIRHNSLGSRKFSEQQKYEQFEASLRKILAAVW